MSRSTRSSRSDTKSLLTLPIFLVASSGAPAVSILSPADTIIGGQRGGGNFEVESEGTLGGFNNWPTPEAPVDLINGSIGGGVEKYLNFAEFDTGVIITPAMGTSIVTGMEFWVAHDVVECDPESFELWGTNSALGGGSFEIAADFTLISSGLLDLPDLRDVTTDTSGNSQVVAVGDGNAHSSYLLLFPTVKDSLAANTMPLSEIQFEETAVPEPSTGLLALISLGLLARRRR